MRAWGAKKAWGLVFEKVVKRKPQTRRMRALRSLRQQVLVFLVFTALAVMRYAGST